MIQSSLVNSMPEAYITLRKGRLKVYKETTPTIYMLGGQEFEIELYNPTTICQLVKIELNGVLISTNGLVLRPGERCYLERFLDSENKFKFDTYTVEKTEQSEKAIALNGKVKITFSPEKIIKYRYPTWKWSNKFDNNSILRKTNIGLNSERYSISSSMTNFGSEVSMDSLSFSDAEYKAKSTNTKETGRIEEGSHSDQKFSYVNKDFELYTSASFEYTILPLSEKVVTSDEIKRYCFSCGAGVKQNHRFCSSCGEKL